MSARPDRSDARLSPRPRPRGRSGAQRALCRRARPDDAGGNSHPELDKFQELEAHNEKLLYEGGRMNEEFVETQCYRDLGSVTAREQTGTGFIKMDRPPSFELHGDRVTEQSGMLPARGTLPATNEWTRWLTPYDKF